MDKLRRICGKQDIIRENKTREDDNKKKGERYVIITKDSSPLSALIALR